MKPRALFPFAINRLSVWLAVAIVGGLCDAQPLPPPLPANANASALAVPATIVGRSANERVWARISSVTNDQGVVSTVQSPAYHELASGICKFSTQSNAWIDADPTIDIVAGGASATGTQHSVTFAADAAAAGGSRPTNIAGRKEFRVKCIWTGFFRYGHGQQSPLGFPSEQSRYGRGR